MIAPQDLTKLKPEGLYHALDELSAHRSRYGRGRTPEAAHVRDYCKAERARVKRELRRRELPATRPGDERTYGPGVAWWQRADADHADLLQTQRDALDVGVQ